IVVLVLLGNLLRSRFGRSFRAVRDDEIAASLAGVHVARTKVLAFAISAACAGLAGAFLALSTGVVNTGEFPLSLSIGILAGMVLGGAGTLTGAWWGAIALVYLPQWSTSLSNDFNLGSGVAAYLATIIYGVVLILVMLLAPSGIQGGLRRLRALSLAILGTGSDNGRSVTKEFHGHDGEAKATTPPASEEEHGPRVAPERTSS
ncbi:MAG: branched-chain amino acid ABC transporter permease, partial [Acidimicrobiales bacterium]